MEAAAQDIIFQADDITVTKTLVRTKKASYPVASIGSVSVVPTPLTPILSIIIVFGVMGMIFHPAWFIIALAGVAGLFRREKNLVLRTGSGDQQALRSFDSKLLSNVREAIELAVVRRG